MPRQAGETSFHRPNLSLPGRISPFNTAPKW